MITDSSFEVKFTTVWGFDASPCPMIMHWITLSGGKLQNHSVTIHWEHFYIYAFVRHEPTGLAPLTCWEMWGRPSSIIRNKLHFPFCKKRCQFTTATPLLWEFIVCERIIRKLWADTHIHWAEWSWEKRGVDGRWMAAGQGEEPLTAGGLWALT